MWSALSNRVQSVSVFCVIVSGPLVRHLLGVLKNNKECFVGLVVHYN